MKRRALAPYGAPRVDLRAYDGSTLRQAIRDHREALARAQSDSELIAPLGEWDALRLALTTEQRSTPLSELALPSTARTFARRRRLVTLGDLAGRSEQELSAGKRAGVSIRDLVERVSAHLAAQEEDRAVARAGIYEGFRALVDQHEPRLRILLTRRSGLGGEGRTFKDLAEMLGVSRERVRQLEGSAWLSLRRREFARECTRRVESALREGAHPLVELARDAWWAGANELFDVVGYVLEHVLEVPAYVVEWDGERWLSPCTRAEVESLWRAVEEAAKAVPLPWSAARVDEFLVLPRHALGERLGARFGQQLRAGLRIESLNGVEHVVGFGDSPRAVALGMLCASPVPMNNDEIQRRLGTRFKLPEEVLYFAPRTVGLEQHFPDFAEWQSRLVPAARAIVEAQGPERQWTCNELLEVLREDHDIPEWLNAWCLGSLVRRSKELRYLGRLRVSLPGQGQAAPRVFIHEAIEKILREAGGPMRKDLLLSKLDEQLGAAALTLKFVLGRPQFVRVDDDSIGLLERDVPGGAAAITDALDHLEAALSRRGAGLSAFHVHQEVRRLSAMHEAWSEAMTMSLVRGDRRFISRVSRAVGLAIWESTRVPTRLELVRSALDEAGERVSVDALMARIAAHYGERPTRNALAANAGHLHAALVGEWLVRRAR